MYIIEALPTPVNAHELEILINAEPATIGHFITHGIPHPDIKAHSRWALP
jgi:4-hydroxy-4-methyl-2-oxoglutarate aldolase